MNVFGMRFRTVFLFSLLTRAANPMRKFLSVTKEGKEQIFISLGLTFVTKNKAEHLNH